MWTPVVTAQEMHRLEQLAVKDGCSEELFMAEAGKKVASVVIECIEMEGLIRQVSLLIGKGNNGGDAWASGLSLLSQHIAVRALPLYPSQECSELNQKFQKRFVEAGGKIEPIVGALDFSEDGLIVDGLLGTGFKGSVAPEMALVIEAAKASKKPIIAIDIPSGLDGTTGVVSGSAIFAYETVALGLAKSGFFLRDGWNHVGRLRVESFGLPQKFINQADMFGRIPNEESLERLFPPIIRNRHKYQAGYVVGFSGSNILRGAPKLAGLAALRSGAGIVRIFHLEEIGDIPIDLICQKWNEKIWEKELARAGSVFLGPGIGRSKKIIQFLKKKLKDITIPMVVDADAIQGGIEYPKCAILTPHRGEVLRLLGIEDDRREEDLLARCQKWAHRHGCILVLKGAPTFIFSQDHPPVIIPRGDPGMAKAGTGDVLTGILAALLAQKVKPMDAAILGVFLHAIAGEKAAGEKSSYGMIASDLLYHLH